VETRNNSRPRSDASTNLNKTEPDREKRGDRNYIEIAPGHRVRGANRGKDADTAADLVARLLAQIIVDYIDRIE
jgi:hypothetical protein